MDWVHSGSSGSAGVTLFQVASHVVRDVLGGQGLQASQDCGLLVVARVAAVIGKGAAPFVVVAGLEAAVTSHAQIDTLTDKPHL